MTAQDTRGILLELGYIRLDFSARRDEGVV
jgi:hypothetical protein